MNRINQFIDELDGKGKVFSALLGVLTLFAILGRIVPGWYEQMPRYSEWICGLTTWSAYNKQADMRIVQSALLGIPVFFLLFASIYVCWKKVMAEKAKTAGAVMVCSYLSVLCLFYRGNQDAVLWMVLWWILFFGYFYLAKKNRTEQFLRIVMAALIGMLALTAVVLCLNGFSPAISGLWQKTAWIVPVVGAIVFIACIAVERCADKAELFLCLQFLLPLAWIGCFRFRYRYEKDGMLLTLFDSGRWKWICVFFCMLFLLLCGIEFRKKGKTLFYSTFVMTAVMRVFSQPEGMMNIDYFHNGEISMPMQQLVSYGKIPYVDLIPIHGLCDYYYGAVNYLFFDGTYLSLNAAKVVGDLFAAVLLATVLYVFTQNRKHSLMIVYFFMPFFVLQAGMRYWFLFLLFFALFSPQIRKGMQSLYVWVLFSILAIAWNVSIGGAAALAFLPMILYRLRRDAMAQWKQIRLCKNRKKLGLTGLAWGLLVAFGIAFIPLFLQIVEYLGENAGTTLYVNGMEMLEDVSKASEYLVPGLINGQGNFFIDTFAFLLPLMVSFALIWKKEKHGAGEMFVTYLLAFWVLANYAFVRYDEGLRTRVLGIFVLILTASTLGISMWREGKERGRQSAGILYVLLLGGAVMISGTQPLISAQTLVLEKEVPQSVRTTIMGKEIDDPVVHVSGTLVSMPGLGTGFIQGNTLQSLQNVNTLVQAAKAKGQSIFDITNAVANAVTMDMPLYLPYSSAYNISNRKMQERAIAQLEQGLPDIILAAPEIRFDDAPFSLRSMHLYRYLMKQDYIPYKYENVIYLVRGENPLPQAQQNAEAFAQLMHKKDLAYLPAVWAANKENVSEKLTQLDVNYQTEPTEQGIRVVFDEPPVGEEVAMIEISGLAKDRLVQEEEKEKAPALLMTIPSSIASEGKVQFRMVCAQGNLLVPVYASPYVGKETMEYIELAPEAADEIMMQDVQVTFYSR